MKHKVLIFVPLVVVFLLLTASVAAAQSPAECVPSAPPFVNEGQNFTVSVLCWSTSPSSNFYGFQFGTSVTGNASTTATYYTPGAFVTGVAADKTLVGQNSIDNAAAGSPGIYAVSRSNGAPEIQVADGQVVLGSVVYKADKGLTSDGDAEVNLTSMLLGNKNGGNIEIYLQDSPFPVTIRDLYTLHLTVASDGTITKVRNVTGSVDSESRGPITPDPAQITAQLDFIDVIDMHDGTPPVLTANMKSHLVCSGPLTLTTSVTAKTVTLKAGDVTYDMHNPTLPATIDILDASVIGWGIGKDAVVYSDLDVNGDGAINVLDLIHVGRNYGAVTGPCALS